MANALGRMDPRSGMLAAGVRPTRPRWGAHLLAAVAVLGLVAGCGGEDPAALQDFPGTSRQQLIHERVDPAVLVIQTEYKATVSVPTIGTNDGALQNLAQSLVDQALNGQIPGDDKSILDAYTKAIADNPDGYLAAQQPANSSAVTVDFQCTGTIVTPDGYIVTAAHCVNVPADQKQDAYVKTGLQPLVDAQVKTFQSEAANEGTFDADQQKQLVGAVSSFLQGHESVSSETSTMATALYSFGNGGQHQIARASLSMVTVGNPPPNGTGPFGDKDVAILKLDGYNDLPTIPVASDVDVEGGQQVYVDGYPGNFQGGSLDSESPSTVTAGPISSKKVSDKGVPLLETTAVVAPGSSGSPGVDDLGRMVGVVSYGSGQYNYLIGASVVLQYLHEKNIQPRTSATTRLYDIALNDYHRQYFKRALPEFQQVKQLLPSHPYVDSFLQRTCEAIQQGEDRTPLIDGTALVLVIAGAAGLVLMVALAVTLLLVRRSPSPRRPGAPELGQPVAAPVHWAAPPGVPAAGWHPPPGPAPATQPPPGPTPPPPPIVSPDGHWRWDGQRWVPNVPSSTD